MIVVLDSSGYCRTGRLKPGLRPMSRISRLTTRGEDGAPDEDVRERHGRPAYCFGRSAGGDKRLAVVDLHVAPLIELDLAGGDHLLAGCSPALIATRSSRTWPGLHEAPLGRELRRRPAVVPPAPPSSGRLHHIDAIAVEAVGDGGARHGEDLARAPASTETLANMPGSSLRFGLARVPRTSSVRVSCATRASSEWILPLNTWPGIGVDRELDSLAPASACRCSARAWGSRPRSGPAPAASPWRGRARHTGPARRGGCRAGRRTAPGSPSARSVP